MGSETGVEYDVATVDRQLLRYGNRKVQQRITDACVVPSSHRGSLLHSAGRAEVRKHNAMNDYDFENELPDEDFQPTAYHWAIAALAVALSAVVVFALIRLGLELHQFLFKYRLQ